MTTQTKTNLGLVEVRALKTWQADLANAEKDLAAFKERFEQNPVYAFTWADTAIEASTKIKHLHWAILDLQNGQPLTGIQNYIQNEVLNRATSFESSSSACSNMVERYTLKALAHMLDQAKYF